MYHTQKKILLDITGIGIIFYSRQSVKHIKEGERYLLEHYNTAEDVLKHIYNGTLVGFGTAGSGTFELNLYVGEAPSMKESNPDFSLKLCIEVSEDKIYFDDLYSLLTWEEDYSEIPFFELESGIYEVAIDSWYPDSGIIGDNQKINMYFTKVDRLPRLKYNGVPTLYNFEREPEKSEWAERLETLSNKESKGNYQREWQIKLELKGSGILFYSLSLVDFLKKGQNLYLGENNYNELEVMLSYIYEGSLVGFGTGGSGIYFLHIFIGQMPSTSITKPEFTFKLCIQVTDNKVYFNDMATLISWEKNQKSIPYIELENGFYEVAVDSWYPDSGKLGDNQRINLYFLKVDILPKLEYKSVPQFGDRFRNNMYAKNSIHSDENSL